MAAEMGFRKAPAMDDPAMLRPTRRPWSLGDAQCRTRFRMDS